METREIKFRVWDKKTDKMYYLTEGKDHGIDYQISIWAGGFELIDISINGTTVISGRDNTITGYRDDGVLMQFTGLQDKNGREIFEGDIVKVDDDWDEYGWMAGEIREVYFFDGSYRLKPPRTDVGRGHTLEDGTDGLSVIGNIYENPELLEEVNND